MATRIFAILRKEFIHILRDFRTLIIIFVMPIFMLFMYGYAINTEIQNIDIAVIDYSNTPASHDLIRGFKGSEFFTVKSFAGDAHAVNELFQRREAQAVLIIPAEFVTSMLRGLPVQLQVLIDASDSNNAQLISSYVNSVIGRLAATRAQPGLFDISTTIRYNPALESAYFFVPGLVALILMMISALLTSIAIAREKETGTMEQILVSPVRPLEIIIGKVVPYIVLAFIDGLLILAVAHFWFEVPARGSLVLILGSSLLYIFVALALGLLISTRVRTQQVAMLAALFASLLPTLMLSGFIFPINSMPEILQLVSKIIPATYYLKIIRGVMLKGSTLIEVSSMVGILVVMGLVLTAVSIKRFKMTL